jgi:hypothetical protein
MPKECIEDNYLDLIAILEILPDGRGKNSVAQPLNA